MIALLNEEHRLQQLAMLHPDTLADAAARLRGGKPSVLYHKLQAEGSAWSRWTVYGDRAVAYALDFCALLAGDGFLPDTECRICCAGCNDGLEVEIFQRAGYRCDGFDLDHEKVRVAQYCGLKVKQGDIHAPPYSEETYHGVFASHVLEHALDLAAACAGLGALLKPGGLLFFVVPLEEHFPAQNPSHTNHIAKLEEILQHFNGWQTIEPRVFNNPELQAVCMLKKPVEQPI